MENQLIDRIFNIKTNLEFESVTLDVFRYQVENNEVYRNYVNYLNINVSEVSSINKIPFLPIEFFKNHKVISKNKTHQTIFESSGTTGQIRSKHFVHDLEIYEKSFIKAFEAIYGNDYILLALLPSYLERDNSSLVYMVNELIKQNTSHESGFYLNNYKELSEQISHCEKLGKKVILIGVTFALLDFVEQFPMKLENTTIIETGGMKGRRKELTRSELHKILKAGFETEKIHSEYGMTELLSQAYFTESKLFEFPAWAKILVRDLYDPFTYVAEKQSGGINVIDLANIYSCSFIETKDIGKLHKDGKFEVLGRSDNSDIRGCNLMI